MEFLKKLFAKKEQAGEKTSSHRGGRIGSPSEETTVRPRVRSRILPKRSSGCFCRACMTTPISSSC